MPIALQRGCEGITGFVDRRVRMARFFAMLRDIGGTVILAIVVLGGLISWLAWKLVSWLA
jgi:hypothetical protein